MKKIIYSFLSLALISCSPSKTEMDEQKRVAQQKELEEFKSSKEYKEYIKNKIVNSRISNEVREMAEEKIISSKNIYYERRIISPADERMCLYNFDGCEYIGSHSIAGTSQAYLTHKGNCKFCHKRDSIMMVSIINNLVKNIVVRYSHH